jgi:hypothetical protein
MTVGNGTFERILYPWGDNMKNLMILAAFVFVGVTARASMIEEYRANLTKFDFQPQSELALANVTAGEIDVAPVTNITLTLYRTATCAPKCKIAYPPVVYQVPVKKRQVGRCGEFIYSGFTDETQDAVNTKITVVDNSHNHCKYFAAIPETAVKLTIQGGKDNLNEYHSMSGKRLVELQ